MTMKRTQWLACVLVAYTAILISVVVFKTIPTLHIGHFRLRLGGPHAGPANLVPFRTVVPQLIGSGNHLIRAVNLLGNFLSFLPIGFVAPLVFRSVSWQKSLVLGIITALTFEGMEGLFRVGTFDIDDVMLNALGVAAGYGVHVLFRRAM
ncbi:hypothetical protein BH10ACI4_BH10ACI4_33890 [soil metagenome]